MDEIRDIELRRLQELRKQAALDGPHTAPHILIEIQDILNRYPEAKRSSKPDERRALDYDFLMNSVAAALQRVTQLEQQFIRDGKLLLIGAAILAVWMVILTAIGVSNLMLALNR